MGILVNDEGWVVIGVTGCSNCMVFKKMLKDHQQECQEIDYNQLANYQKDKYTDMARHKGCAGLPIILLNGKIMDMPDAIKLLNERV